VPLFRLLLDAFPIVQCNSRKSFSTAAVVGVGAPLAIYPSWAYARTTAPASLSFACGADTQRNVDRNEQSSNTEVFKYYSTSSDDAVSNMVQGTRLLLPRWPSTFKSLKSDVCAVCVWSASCVGFTDFGGLDVELTAQEAASMPDVAVVPMVAYAVAAAYSVDVFAYGSLRFDLPTLADIYLGKSRTRTHRTHRTHRTRSC
jgi:hypothetical protein